MRLVMYVYILHPITEYATEICTLSVLDYRQSVQVSASALTAYPKRICGVFVAY